MSAFGIWTWIAIGVLLVLPPIVLVVFLRDAVRLFRELGSPRDAPGDPPGSGTGPGDP